MNKRLCTVISLTLLIFSKTWATENDSPLKTSSEKPVISIIIDDLGNQLQIGARAIALPGAVTYSFLPYSPYASQLANMAYRQRKEVMLHLPMEPIHHHDAGEGRLTLAMSHQEFSKTIRANLAAIPHVSGINNHMGSLLTQYTDRMQWLMNEILKHGNLFFIDSRTINYSVANKSARQNDIPNASRDIFLDHERNPDTIRSQFYALLAIARHKGSAVAIGHPYPETMLMLEQELPRLKALGIRLVSASRIINYNRKRDINHTPRVIMARVLEKTDPTLDNIRSEPLNVISQ